MPTNTTINLHHIVITANIFVRKDSKYLMLRRSPLKEVLPNLIAPLGGKIEEAEDPLLGAQRELYEESGLKVKNIRLEAVVTEVLSPDDTQYKNNWLIFHFSGDWESGEATKSDEGELLWMTEEELLQAPMFPSVKTVLPFILSPDDSTVFARFEYDKERSITKQHITVTKK